MDTKDLAFISDNSVDKIVESGSGSFSIAGNSNGSATIPHSFGKMPLFNVQWSVDNVNWFPTTHIDNQTYGPLSWTQVWAYSDASNLVVYGECVGGSRTCYYKYELFFSELW